MKLRLGRKDDFLRIFLSKLFGRSKHFQIERITFHIKINKNFRRYFKRLFYPPPSENYIDRVGFFIVGNFHIASILCLLYFINPMRRQHDDIAQLFLKNY